MAGVAAAASAAASAASRPPAPPEVAPAAHLPAPELPAGLAVDPGGPAGVVSGPLHLQVWVAPDIAAFAAALAGAALALTSAAVPIPNPAYSNPIQPRRLSPLSTRLPFCKACRASPPHCN